MVIAHIVGDNSLAGGLDIMRSGLGDGLSKGKHKISELLAQCASTSAFAQARARLPLTWLRRLLGIQAQQLRSLAKGWQWKGFFVHVVDGTMMTMRPYGRIPKSFPPHSNQLGKTYWCQMRVLACMCLGTGIILSLVVGHSGDSEQAQLVRLMLFGGVSSWPGAATGSILWMGDANFGVWRVVAAAGQSGQHVLVRLTQVRAAKLAASVSHRLNDGLDLKLFWEPSRHDQADRGLKRVGVEGRLIVKSIHAKGFRPIELMLFTTIDSEVAALDIAEFVALYVKRWRIELCLRHFKTQMGLGELKSQSPAMAKRELLTGVIAHNLVRGLMLIASGTHGRSVWALSFAQAQRELAKAVELIMNKPSGDIAIAWEQVLRRLDKGRLPKRRKPRPTEPRKKRHRRETFPPLQGDRQSARAQAKLEAKGKS
jgi:hypothetical protein